MGRWLSRCGASGEPKASALIEKGGRLELFGLADLTMTGQTAIDPPHWHR